MTGRRPLVSDRLPRHLVELYHKYSFTDVDTGFAFAYDTVAEWEDVTARAMGYLLDAITPLIRTDPRLAAQEHEFVEKMCTCWRLRGFGTLYEPQDSSYSCRNADQAMALTPWLRRRCRDYLAWMRSVGSEHVSALLTGGTVVLDKGKGAPYWSPGGDHEVCLAYARLGLEASSYDALEHAVRAAGAARMPFCQTSYIRVQAARKPTPAWQLLGQALQPAGERLKPKVRRIGAQPFAVNHLWAGVGNVLRTAMASIDQRTTGTVEPAAAATRQWSHTMAFDLASYDTTVSLETQNAVRSELLGPILAYLALQGIMTMQEVTLLMEADAATQELGILVPPATTLLAGDVVPAAGQTRSGENLTSWKGTEINRARIDSKMQTLGLRNGRDATAFNYGDDTVLMFDSARAVDRWAGLSHYLGFNETVAPDVTFLMRRLPDGYTYLGRMVAACINREPQLEPQDALSAAAAMATRRELLRGHPLEERFDPILNAIASTGRWRDARSLATGGASAVTLTQIAAARQMRAQPTLALDGYMQQLQSLGAENQVEWLVRQLVESRRQLPWGQLRAEAAKLTRRDAEKMLAARSYCLEH